MSFSAFSSCLYPCLLYCLSHHQSVCLYLYLFLPVYRLSVNILFTFILLLFPFFLFLPLYCVCCKTPHQYSLHQYHTSQMCLCVCVCSSMHVSEISSKCLCLEESVLLSHCTPHHNTQLQFPFPILMSLNRFTIYRHLTWINETIKRAISISPHLSLHFYLSILELDSVLQKLIRSVNNSKHHTTKSRNENKRKWANRKGITHFSRREWERK
jgi:hypothetical protein